MKHKRRKDPCSDPEFELHNHVYGFGYMCVCCVCYLLFVVYAHIVA